MQQPPYRTSGVVDANGRLELTLLGRASQPIRVTQVTVEMGAGGNTAACTVRFNGSLISPMVPTGDAAVGEPPIWLQPGDVLSAVWEGATPGETGVMLAIYDYGPSS